MVDDERNILTSLGMALEAEGYKVRTYSDGAAALEALSEEPADLAILDIKMPRMDGMELLRKSFIRDAPRLEAKLRTDPEFQKLLQDVTSDLQITNPQVSVDIDRDKASSLGVTANQVEDALYTAYGQRQISTIYAPNNAYRVITELENQYQLDPSALSMLYVRSSNGQAGPAQRGGQAHAFAGTADDQSPGTVARGHDLIQSAAGSFAGRRGERGWQSRARNVAGNRQHQLSGHGAGL